MKKTYLFMLTLINILVAGVPSVASAADPVTINVTGNIIASPCVVESDSITKNIDLGKGGNIQTKDLQTAGAATEWVTFDVKIKDCPQGTTYATINFSGTPDENSPDSMYQNSGTAKNVAVELQGTGGDHFGNGKSYKGTIFADGTYSYHLRSRAYTTAGGVTPGSVQAVVTASFTYQ